MISVEFVFDNTWMVSWWLNFSCEVLKDVCCWVLNSKLLIRCATRFSKTLPFFRRKCFPMLSDLISTICNLFQIMIFPDCSVSRQLGLGCKYRSALQVKPGLHVRRKHKHAYVSCAYACIVRVTPGLICNSSQWHSRHAYAFRAYSLLGSLHLRCCGISWLA